MRSLCFSESLATPQQRNPLGGPMRALSALNICAYGVQSRKIIDRIQTKKQAVGPPTGAPANA